MDSTTFLLLMIALLLGATGSIWAVWYYFEKSKPERMKRVKKQRYLDPEDEAYNLVMSTKSICRVMKNKGNEVSSAEILLDRAELALDAKDHTKAKQLAEKAKEKIKNSQRTGQPSLNVLNKPDFDRPKSKAVKKFEESKENIQNLPENYLESKFEIDVARDLVEKRGDQEASRLLKLAEDKFSTEDYSGALSYAIKCKKWIDEESAGLMSAQIVGKGKPGKESKELSLKNLSKPKIEEVYECVECGNEVGEDDKFCNKCGAKITFLQTCPACDTEVKTEYKFCPKCGEDLGSVIYECPECGAEVDEDIRFCPNCGISLD